MNKRKATELPEKISFYNVRMAQDTYKKIKKSAIDQNMYIAEWFSSAIDDKLEKDKAREIKNSND